MNPTTRKIVVVIPAYNEAAVVGQVIDGVLANLDGMDATCLVVDDGSTDRTSEIARNRGASVIRHCVNLGVGAATRTGLLAARELRPDVVVTVDGDGQHDPTEIPSLIRCLTENDLDVVIGSRILHLRVHPPSRVAANLLLNVLTLIAYRKVVLDPHSGFRAFNRRSLDVMELSAAGYEFCWEIIGEIVRNQLNYKSLPVKAVYTAYSQAKGQPLLNGVNLVLDLFVRMLRRV
jgi:polyprenyl-phospho-N-acetylgalactosaminyl synthase